MKHTHTAGPLNRRHFLQTSLLGTTALASFVPPLPARAALTKTQRDPWHGLKVGIASYTFRNFSLDQTIEWTKQAGMKYICLKSNHLPFKSTPTERQQARQKLETAGLTLIGGGVINMNNNEDEIRNYFEYAKDAGMPTIVCSPDPAAIDTVEHFAKQYNIQIAIHNHGPTDKRYPSPLDVLALVNNRDRRLGLCMDVGHTVRIKQDPIPIIERCAPRLYDFHMKDETAATPQGTPVEVGKGVIDVVGVLKKLLEIKFQGHLGLEFEPQPTAPLPGVMDSAAYLRGILAAI